MKKNNLLKIIKYIYYESSYTSYIYLKLDNIKIIILQWDILLLYKLNKINKYNYLIVVYHNFCYSLYNGV